MHDGVVVGQGYNALNAQNGVQVAFGAQGSVKTTKISEIGYTPATFVASGVLVYQAGGPVAVSDLNGVNKITNVQAPVSWYDASGSMDGIEVSGGADYGPIYVRNTSTSLVSGAGIESVSRPNVSRPQISLSETDVAVATVRAPGKGTNAS